MPSTTKVPAAALTVERFTLPNGLRVVVAPDRGAPVVGVNVSYDVGFRSEPEGRTGFAHLFEHLMFQGSDNVGKMEHARLVQGAGGVMNGSTHPDYTNYYQALPTGALELALFLEADRMRAPRLTQENLDNQIAVVQEEIRVNVLNQPYGGFPWITLPPVAFDSFANAHNGYGDFAELASSTLEDARDFFARYYAPGNAVLAVAGDVDPDAVAALVERHFGDVAARDVPARPDFGEPWTTTERRGTQHDAIAPQPAVAVGWRVPDPVGRLEDYLATVVLAEVLSDGDASRLQRRLVLDDRIATGVSAYLGTFGDPFDGRDPVLLTVETTHTAEVGAERILATVDEELARLATDGLLDGELERVQARLGAQLLRASDSVMNRTNTVAVLELLHGRGELAAELPARLAAVPPAAVVAAAAALSPVGRAVLELVPGRRIVTTATQRVRPTVLRTKAARPPATAERVLPNGLRVVAVRRPAVPLVELRLRIPFPGLPGPKGRKQTARATVLAETLFSGTAERSSLRIAQELQAVGGALGAGVDADRLIVSGSGLANGLPRLLEVLADVLGAAAYPRHEVEGERERLVQDLVVARSQPSVLAGVALARRLYGEHHYAGGLPQAADVEAVTPGKLRSLHAERLVPDGALLLVVGDVRPAAALDAVERALGGWARGAAAPTPPPLPAVPRGPVLVVDRPGAVQSNLRLAGPAVPRDDPAYAALQLANTVFGGYFSSRLVANIREDKGYTYSPRSSVEHNALGSLLQVGADVATEVTAPALLETRYELGRIASVAVTDVELEDARRYAIGTLALSTASQAGLASTLTALLGRGLDLGWLREHPARLERVTVSDVREAAHRFFAPAAFVTVVLGDAARIVDGLEALDAVEVQSAAGL